MSGTGYLNKWWLFASFAAPLVQLAHASEVRAEDGAQATYTVKAGDSLGAIAERHGVSLAPLRKVNGILADTIRPGQVLLLPTLHEVKPGEVLGTIAQRYGVKLSELYRLNDLDEGSVLKVGQRVVVAGDSRDEPASKPEAPDVEYYEHEVRPNEVLSVIAKRFAVTTEQLCRLNQLGDGSLIRVGQGLKIPVNDDNAHLTRPKPWSKYARKDFERGRVTLKTLGGEWTGRVLDEKGNLLPEASKRIQSMLGSWETGRQKTTTLHPRLYALIVLVSDEFGGRPIRVVSGYRERSHARHSKHPLGRALDFSIPGVPNSALVDFLLTLPNTGVGYYPNSTHVHIDVRSSRMHWVDVSGPGQAPRYVYKSTTGERAPIASSTKPTRLPSASKQSEGARIAQLEPRRR